MTGQGWQTGADIHKGHPLDLIPTIAPTQWLISTEHLWLRALIHAPCINGYINICIHVRLVSCNPFRDTRRWRVEALNPSEEGRRYDLFNRLFQHEFMSHSQLNIHPWTAQQNLHPHKTWLTIFLLLPRDHWRMMVRRGRNDCNWI